MQHDPAPYIIGAAILGGMIGFFGCALFASYRIIEDRREAWWDGYAACNREHNDPPEDSQHLTPRQPTINGRSDAELIHEHGSASLRSDQNQVLAKSWLHKSSL